MKTLTELAEALDLLAEKIVPGANEAKKLAANIVLLDLAKATPADTGAAISNWQVTIGAQAAVAIPPYAPMPRGRMISGRWTHTVDPGVTKAANIPRTYEAGKAILSIARPSEVIFITSVLPYAERLNAGSSEQAPAGFVERAMVLGRNVIDTVKFVG